MKRTWKERLLTRPWRPFLKTKEIDVPAMYIVTPPNWHGWPLFSDQPWIMCHPAMKAKLDELLAAANRCSH